MSSERGLLLVSITDYEMKVVRSRTGLTGGTIGNDAHTCMREGSESAGTLPS